MLRAPLARQHAFAASGTYVGVEAFRAPEVTETALGEVRIWYGTVASVALETPHD